MGSLQRLEEVRSLVQATRALQLGPLVESSYESKVAFKVLSLRETLLFRSADLSDAALLLVEDHEVAAAILARSVLETTAVLVALQVAVMRFNAGGSSDTLDEEVTKLLLGSRKREPVATNIQTHIDRMAKLYEKRLSAVYADLSEHAHPNAAGVIVSYGTLSRGSSALVVGKESSDNLGEVALLALCICLKILQRAGSETQMPLGDPENGSRTGA